MVSGYSRWSKKRLGFLLFVNQRAQTRSLSKEEIQVFRDLFDSYDTDKGGQSPSLRPWSHDDDSSRSMTDADRSHVGNISVEEFAQVMAQSPGKPPSKEEVEKIIKEVDLDGDGSINFNEFITMMTGQPYPPPSQESEEEYARAWKEYETSLNGSITASQFRQLMAGLGEPVTDVEVEQLINNIDGEGKLSYREFVHFMNNRGIEMDIVNSYQ
ncbi:EF-hand [Nemania sp. FL0031]|nr:EF-hand [Nemania sp. FL0031]